MKICQTGLQLVFTFDNRFSSSGRLSSKGCPLKLPSPSLLQPATSQARLHDVPGQTSMHVGQWLHLPPPSVSITCTVLQSDGRRQENRPGQTLAWPGWWVNEKVEVANDYPFRLPYTADEVRIQYKCLVTMYVFPEMKLRGLVIFKTELQFSVSQFPHCDCMTVESTVMHLWAIFIFIGSVCLFCCCQIGRSILGI